MEGRLQLALVLDLLHDVVNWKVWAVTHVPNLQPHFRCLQSLLPLRDGTLHPALAE